MKALAPTALACGLALLAHQLPAAAAPAPATPATSAPQSPAAFKALAHDIYQQLVEINTSQSVGDTYEAAKAMGKRLTDAGFPASDVQVFESGPKRGNLVARLHGTGARAGGQKLKPILLLAHIDVVEAKREDWTTDPFKFVEKDGYYYGRGSADDKGQSSIFVANLIRYKQEGYKPKRDIILALTTDEEISDEHSLGIRWLIANHRDLIDAEFALNEGGPLAVRNGKPSWSNVQTTEKLFQNFWLEVRNKGGHSSQPTSDNAIYRLANGLHRLETFQFPIAFNETTRRYFQTMSTLEQGQNAADMKAILAPTPDPGAIERLTAQPPYNSLLHTTCVATRLEGGHADNALPQLARALVNCRIMPGEGADRTQATLQKVLDDDQIKISVPSVDTPSDPSPLTPQILRPIEKLTAKFWPGIPVLPTMSAGATDGRFLRNIGTPTYGHSGIESDVFDMRSHGKDERVRVGAYYTGQEYLYQLVKLLTQ